MGLMDQVIDLMENAGGQAGPLQGALRSMLDNGSANQPTGQATTGGGLSGLISAFQQAGMGHIVQSWIGNGPNQSVSSQQLHTALGNDRVQDMADQSGLAPQDLLSQLSRHLPDLINRLTPHGQPPASGAL